MRLNRTEAPIGERNLPEREIDEKLYAFLLRAPYMGLANQQSARDAHLVLPREDPLGEGPLYQLVKITKSGIYLPSTFQYIDSSTGNTNAGLIPDGLFIDYKFEGAFSVGRRVFDRAVSLAKGNRDLRPFILQAFFDAWSGKDDYLDVALSREKRLGDIALDEISIAAA